MMKWVTQAKPDPTMLLLLAPVGVVGVLVARRYGVVSGLRTVNRALDIARTVQAGRLQGNGLPASKVRPKVVHFAKPR
jgi:hypothetical protein